MSGSDMAKKIRDLRQAREMTLEDVAKIVGVGKSTVRKWETGMIKNMKRDKIASLANALDTTPAYLMGWIDEQEEKKNDIQADIILRMRSDTTFMSVVEKLYSLDQDKLESINQMLHTLFK